MNTITFDIAQDEHMQKIEQLVKSVGGSMTDASASQFLLARLREEIIGCARIWPIAPNVQLLASLAVASEYRRQGVGRALVSRCLSLSPQGPVYLLCFSDREDFYAQNGFVRIDPSDLPPVLFEHFQSAVRRNKNTAMHIMGMVLT